MSIYVFSRQADRDLDAIADFTKDRWGMVQAETYLLKLGDACQIIAEHPEIGRPCDLIRPGLRRIESGRRVIFYRLLPNGIKVTRILHDAMLPSKHKK